MNKTLLLLSLLAVLMAGCSVETPSAPIDQDSPALSDQPSELETEVSGAEDSSAASADAAVGQVAELIDAFTAPAQVQGDLLLLYGRVLNVNGDPVPEAVVEIWQTDSTGVYDHPQDPGTASRDMSFQFYGSSTADDEGRYAFRTVLPGRYEPRPRHIHYKVKQGGRNIMVY